MFFLLTLQPLSILGTYQQSKNMAKNMEAPFVFGVRVEGDAFTYGGGVETSRSHSPIQRLSHRCLYR